MKNTTPDSLIFDMDGTLWDALDTYTYCWNEALTTLNTGRSTTREELHPMMGWQKEKVLQHFFKDVPLADSALIFDKIIEIQDEVLPIKGGKLYDDVKEGLKTLSKKYKLFILSNCPKNTIKQFVQWAGLEDVVIDHIAFGENEKPKHFNMQLLKDKHQLSNPFYIGDTETDSLESEKAGFPFIFLSYGFGKTDVYHQKFDDFRSLTAYFMEL